MSTFNAQKEASYIFLCILETHQIYGAEVISQILAGNENHEKCEAIKANKYFSWHSIQRKPQHIKSIIYKLLEDGYLTRTEKYKSLKLNEVSLSFMLEPKALFLEKDILIEKLFAKELTESDESTQILFETGLQPQEIAEKRKLSINTIYNHISNLIFHKKIHNINNLLAEDKQKIIHQKVKNYKNESLPSLKKSLPESISYNDIKIMLAKQLQTA